MGNLFDYLDWRGDLSFSEVGFGEIDSLILSTISYVDFDGIVPHAHGEKSIALLAAARQYLRVHSGEQAYLGAILPPETLTLMVKAAKTKRFANVRLTGYENKLCSDTELQFSAITYMLGNNTIFVAFRGTDDTLVGWKENFNMSFMTTVPAQLEAVNYLTAAANATSGDIYVGGHSKGGNLAVFSTVRCAPYVKERIRTTYNNDGPGFSDIRTLGDAYEEMLPKIETYVPESSVIGLLLERNGDYTVVKSSSKGLLQHDAMSWEVLGASFVTVEGLSQTSVLVDQILKNWLKEISKEEREVFVDTLFGILETTKAKNIDDLNVEKAKAAHMVLKEVNGLDRETKMMLAKTISALFKEGNMVIKGLSPVSSGKKK